MFNYFNPHVLYHLKTVKWNLTIYAYISPKLLYLYTMVSIIIHITTLSDLTQFACHRGHNFFRLDNLVVIFHHAIKLQLLCRWHFNRRVNLHIPCEWWVLFALCELLLTEIFTHLFLDGCVCASFAEFVVMGLQSKHTDTIPKLWDGNQVITNDADSHIHDKLLKFVLSPIALNWMHCFNNTPGGCYNNDILIIECNWNLRFHLAILIKRSFYLT